ncbi:MAG: hypothetical protein Q7U04_16040, partial [Bacteriovorax sp.]|nr:hypothetical protein [Bacteriovorax sp.]
MKNLKQLPNKQGYFGEYGGQIIPPVLQPAFAEIEKAYAEIKIDPKFISEYNDLLENYVGRPSPLYFARNLTAKLGGA